MEKTKNYLILGLALTIMVLFLLKGCGGRPSSATYIKGKDIVTWDTIKNTDTLVKFKPKYYPKWDTIRKVDTLWNADLCKFERTYNDTLVDTNITIYSKLETIGILKSSKVSYIWKKPELIKNINRVDTIIKPNKWNLYGGLEVGGNKTTFNVSPYLSLNANRNTFTLRYGVLDQTYSIGVGIRLIKSKK